MDITEKIEKRFELVEKQLNDVNGKVSLLKEILDIEIIKENIVIRFKKDVIISGENVFIHAKNKLGIQGRFTHLNLESKNKNSNPVSLFEKIKNFQEIIQEK